MLKDLIIFEKAYTFTLWLYAASSKFPKNQRFTLGTSQLFSNIYLNELDQYVKHHLHVRRYVRYMDDFTILHDDKEYLRAMKDEITGFLAARLSLVAHPHKVRIDNTARGVAFLGHRIFPHHRLLRGSTVRRFAARAKVLKRAGGGGLSEGSIRLGQAWAVGAH